MLSRASFNGTHALRRLDARSSPQIEDPIRSSSINRVGHRAKGNLRNLACVSMSTGRGFRTMHARSSSRKRASGRGPQINMHGANDKQSANQVEKVKYV